MKERSQEPELIDLGATHYTAEEYDDCLYKLDRIGRLLGGDRATLKGLRTLQKGGESILDVGCGGGLFALKLAQRYPHTAIVGLDISEEAIRFAQAQISKQENITFVHAPSPVLQYPPNTFDIVMSTLMCHHLSDSEIVTFLKRAYEIAKEGVIINDLHRHWLASASYAIVAPLLFPNRLILHDGLLSIKKGFIKSDWERYLKQANIPTHQVSITWHWAFRWVIVIDKRRKP